MNVTCPECKTTYRVDPAKVPSGGVLAQCARCPATFTVADIEDAELETFSALVVTAPADERESGSDEKFGGSVGEASDAGGVLGDDAAGVSDVGRGTALGDEDGRGYPAVQATTGGESIDQTEFEDEPEGEYAGASDVAFHTEATALDELPYLQPSAGPTSDDAGEADLPESAQAATETQPTSGEEAGDAGDEFGADAAGAPGEMPLPPAPFGARSDPHRRAARLARALVSDIVVYHPERRTRSLRQGTLRQEFREEIRKSWEEYANQVGGDFARQTTYFKDALNEILAEGATVF